MEDIYFSMIVYVDNDELLKKSIDSMIGPQVKIIVVDSICSEKSMDLCTCYGKKYGEKRFKYFKTYGMSIGEAYNVAIPEMKGRYVNFSLASTWFSQGSINAIQEIAEDEKRPKLISLSPWTVNEKQEYVQYKMSPVAVTGNFCDEINLSKEPRKLQLMFHAYFIRCYLINSKERHMWFKPELFDDACMEMLLQLLAEIRGYLYLPKLKINYTHQLEDNFTACVNQQYEWWYLSSMKNWILPFAREWNSKDYPIKNYLRIALFYLVYARFNCNYNNRNKGILDKEQVEEFTHLAGQVFQYIDSRLIFKKDAIPNFVIPRGMRILFLKLKATEVGKVCENVLNGNNLCLWTHSKDNNVTRQTLTELHNEYAPTFEELEKIEKELDVTNQIFTIERNPARENDVPIMKMAYDDDTIIPLCQIEKEHVILRVINYKKGYLEIDGILSLGNFLDKRQIQLIVIKDGKHIPVQMSEVYGLEKVFGITYDHKYMFHASISVYATSKKSYIQFAVKINDKISLLEIRTQTVYSHIKQNLKGQYWRFENDWCLSLASNNEMCITMVTEGDVKKLESAFQKTLEERFKKGDKFAKKALALRKKYFEWKAELNGSRIWVTFDKLYKAGDNGEYLYKYIAQQSDDIQMYYIVNQDSPDYERLINEGVNVLAWGEPETLVIALLAEAVLATHADAFSFTGFKAGIMPYICDLFQPINVCIQHGLTVQNIANLQNRLVDNIQLYMCASQKEIDNLSQPIYGYAKESLKLTGLARYDGLKNADQHQILITPTWRRGLAVASKMGSRRGYSDAFKNSEYYKIYNKLIHDPKLIATAKEAGYRIIYLLHPTLTAQVCDFDQTGDVEIMTTTDDMSYEKILTESSLMITDYSGVQFDFAYMRKPLIYYHPKTLPPHYDESEAYIYEKDAFGPLIDNHEELVDTICDYIKNQCKMKEEYKARADRFFAYSDFENCSRIYNAIRSYIDE